MAEQDKKRSQSKGKMTVEQAGRMGGEATSESHGREFYEEIGRKGGEAPHEKRGQHGSDRSTQSAQGESRQQDQEDR